MSDRPTPEEVAAALREVAGDGLVGAYLYGSATAGGLRRHSDVDVLGVVGRSLESSERAHLVGRLLEISGSRARRGLSRPVELTLVVQSDVRPWRYPPREDFQYGEWLRGEYESGVVPQPRESPDLAVLLAMVLQSGRPLFGPPPETVLDPVPAADLRRALVDALPALLADLETDRNVVLTLARMWLTLETGEFAPKDAAADWALARLPPTLHVPLIHARDVYLDHAADAPLDVPAVRSYADHVVSQIERAGSS